MMKRLMIGLVLSACVVPLSLQAGMFGWIGNKDRGETPEAASTNVVKRFHLKISDKTAEKEFLQLTGVKRILFEERQVLMMLLEEKRRDMANLESEFEKTFGIKRDRSYRYDAKTMTILEQAEKTNSATNAPGTGVQERVVKKFDSESESRKFASLAAAKQMTQEDMVVLSRLVREKTVASGRIENSLNEKFSMSRDRNYWYDGSTMQLYELVKPSSKGVVQ